MENDIGIICACLPALAPLRNTRFFGKILPDSVDYILRKSGYSSSKSSSPSGGASSKTQSNNRMGYQSFESGVELVEDRKGDTKVSASDDRTHESPHEHGAIRREIDMEVLYSHRRKVSDLA